MVRAPHHNPSFRYLIIATILYFCSVNLHSPALIESIKKLFTNKYFILTLWFGLSFIAALKQDLLHVINNYKIYKFTFYHLIHQQNIFLPDISLYEDKNHYGPVFALVIAPFYMLPDSIAVILWNIFNSFMLYKAVMMLPINNKKQIAIFFDMRT